jgi:two-component system, NarL family, response regulator NreC
MGSVRIILVDDHKLVRQGMRSLLEAQSDYEVVGEAGDGQDALRLVETLRPQVAILDMMMPGLNGIEVARIMRDRHLDTRVIILSMHASAIYAVRALHGGALAYVLKDADFSEMLQAIKNVLNGKRYLSQAIADEVLEILLNTESNGPDLLTTLSSREREVLQLVSEGNTNAQVAEKLSISVRTVEAHRANLMAKLHLSSQSDLVRFAIAQGLITA